LLNKKIIYKSYATQKPIKQQKVHSFTVAQANV